MSLIRIVRACIDTTEPQSAKSALPHNIASAFLDIICMSLACMVAHASVLLPMSEMKPLRTQSLIWPACYMDELFRNTLSCIYEAIVWMLEYNKVFTEALLHIFNGLTTMLWILGVVDLVKGLSRMPRRNAVNILFWGFGVVIVFFGAHHLIWVSGMVESTQTKRILINTVSEMVWWFIVLSQIPAILGMMFALMLSSENEYEERMEVCDGLDLKI